MKLLNLIKYTLGLPLLIMATLIMIVFLFISIVFNVTEGKYMIGEIEELWKPY